MHQSERARRTRIGIAVLLAAVGFCCFARVLGFGFVYDDHWTIVENQALKRPLLPMLGALLVGSRGIPDSTRPTMVSSVWFDRRLFGTSPIGYHAHSLLLYALCCALAGMLIFALTRRWRIALGSGIFFAVAPVHAEAVAAVNYREDVIAAIVVIGVLAWIFWPRMRPESPRAACGIALLWLLGLGAKESAIAVVVVTLGIGLLLGRGRAWLHERRWTFLAMLAALLVWGVWRVSLRMRGFDDVPLAGASGPLERLLGTARYETQVLASSLAPIFWSPEYEPQPSASALWLLPFGAAIAAAIALSRRRGTRALGIGIAFALLAALPTSPLVGPANERADRFVFLSLLGGAMAWGWPAERVLAGRRILPNWGVFWVLLPVLVPMVAISQRAEQAWKSDLELWTVASVRAPGSYRSWVGLSSALRISGDLEGAEAAVERALALYPNSRSAHVTRAYVRLARGDVAGARADIQRVRDLGGAHQRGLERAAECAELAGDQTRACIEGRN